MKHFILPLALVLAGHTVFAQYKITPKYDVECTEIKNQERTGTCWSFATSSFLESEVKRSKKMDIDLSEMFSVRATYMDKAQNYILRQGKANYSEGSLSHDVIKAVERVGVVPETVFSGKSEGIEIHNHSEMVSATKGMLDGLQKRKTLSPRWKAAMGAILDIYMGDVPETFKYEGKEYTPKSFADFLGIKGSDYISLTSYTHHPFYQSFVLEIPDNYSNGFYQNVPMKDLEKIVDNAIQNGFSVAWDGDVSEATFNHKEGLAILPEDTKRENLWDKPDTEVTVTQELRQSTFESKATTDDHLMHLVGIAYDNKGTKYYKIKNSWGTSNTFEGYLYMSQAYFQLKTVGVLLHKGAVPKSISKKFQ
jgi:bleomycin hydrolase